MRFLTLISDRRGVAAVELALAVPILAAIAVVSFDIWKAGSSRERAAAGLETAVGYYFNGGTRDDDAVAAATTGWASRPADGVVTAARVYRCDDVITLNQTCPNGTPVDVYVRLKASGSGDGMVYSPDIIARRSVRVR